MNNNPFYLFLRYVSVVTESSRYETRKSSDSSSFNAKQDPFVEAMNMLESGKRAELIGFIDHALSTIDDPSALARIFDNGNLFFSWKSDDGPRLALLTIRKLADASSSKAPEPRTPLG